MTTGLGLDRRMRAAIAGRPARRPWWQRLGNFGFGFIFIGALLDAALFVVVATLEVDFTHWGLACLVLSLIGGWLWRHGRPSNARGGRPEGPVSNDGSDAPDFFFDVAGD